MRCSIPAAARSSSATAHTGSCGRRRRRSGRRGCRRATGSAADARFTGIGEDEESDGRWRFAKPLGETWPMDYDGIAFLGRFTAFRHVGVFPEQATALALARSG